MGGRAWWLIDMMRLQQAMARGDTRDSNEVPEGLTEARDAVVKMLAEADTLLSPSKVVLGGFSQGAMLSCDVALRAERSLAGLVMLSGTFIAEDEWRPLMPRRSGLHAFLSHGASDAMLPFAESERLRDALGEAGLAVTWSAFRGGHQIPGSVLDALSAFLRPLLVP
jgi:phospholipase/carboxylesterase